MEFDIISVAFSEVNLGDNSNQALKYQRVSQLLTLLSRQQNINIFLGDNVNCDTENKLGLFRVIH